MKTTLRSELFTPKWATFRRGLGLVLLGVIVAGCQQQPTKTEKQSLIIRGSNTFGEELAPKLVADFKKSRSDLAIDTEFKGTSYGMGALLAGRCDIAAASRTLTTNEVELAKYHSVDLNDYVVGVYSVAVVVNGNSPVSNLTQDQVRDIFTGVVQNWKDVGGPDAAIHLYIRDPISGTYLGFQELAMERKPYGPGLKAFMSYADIVQAVAQDPSGIGYSSIEDAAKSGVKAVSIGGVPANVEAVNKGQYPYSRVLRLYTDKAKESPAAQEFVQFVVSKNGQQIVEQTGYVPHP